MTRAIFFAVALVLCGADSALAAGAAFGCDAGGGQTCYFRIYYTPGLTRLVQLTAGMKVTVPDADVGHTRYCVAVGKPPAPKCSQKQVNDSYND
ncbi:MAG TPA: hypothetical protein VG100_07750 [Xanthobacteraceae bacterium]|jgi:hypothetical protein|nr:hypothetical protein [Xanthobacteraceae bacterium]